MHLSWPTDGSGRDWEKISAGAPEIDSQIDAASLLLKIYVSAFLASTQ